MSVRPSARIAAAALVLSCAIRPHEAVAQSVDVESALTAGGSTEDASAAAVQLRAFGDAVSGVRFFTEAAWGARSGGLSDTFGAAYPYSNRVQVIEAFGERVFRPAAGILGVRVGRYRTPFGISSGSDHAYGGFLRAPLVRYDGYFALSNNFLEEGADIVAGIPRLTLEASVGRPSDVGTALRRPGVDAVLRVQGTLGSLILGASRIETQPYFPDSFAQGRAAFSGVDARWMRGGVQLRGEWLTGRPFDGTTTTGWYADAIVHRVAMGPLTAVARVEQLDYRTVPEFALHERRQTVGARVRVAGGLSLEANVVHQTGTLPDHRPTALDAGVTYSVRHEFRRR